MKKLIRYRISIAVTFPATHPRKGEATLFVDKIKGNYCLLHEWLAEGAKIHTIRGNYELWAKRFEKIDKGDAVLELYTWSGKPYNSKQVVFATLGKEDGIGLQKLIFTDVESFKVAISNESFGFLHKKVADIAKNDGLSLDDFKAWFKGTDLSKPLAIIHFTDFRY